MQSAARTASRQQAACRKAVAGYAQSKAAEPQGRWNPIDPWGGARLLWVHSLEPYLILKRGPLILFMASCLAGLFTGYGVKRASHVESRDAQESADQAAVAKNERLPSSPDEVASVLAGITAPRPSDTLESLKADETNLYPRLAQWLVHATSEEIAAYWAHYSQRPVMERDGSILQLLFLQWARLDATALLAAAKASQAEEVAWWAFASHDPGAALAAVSPADEKAFGSIGWAIGRRQQKWFREHYDELPDAIRKAAVNSFGLSGPDADPAATLAFLSEKGLRGQDRMLGKLAEVDPWAAYDWLQKKGKTASAGEDPEKLQSSFIAALGKHHPEVLEQIAASAAPGAGKREMEATLFGKLLLEDPEAALKQAQETKASVVAVERLAKVGMQLEGKDAERIFTIAGQIVALTPNFIQAEQVIAYEKGTSSLGGASSEAAREFSQRLMRLDPARAMNLIAANGTSTTLQTMGRNWMASDPNAYADWVEQLGDPQVRDFATVPLVSRLIGKKEYSAAADWAKSMTEPSQQLAQVIQKWQRSDAEGARAWVNQAGLPEETKQKLEPHLKPKQ